MRHSVICIAALLLTESTVLAQPGTLDPAFGNGGTAQFVPGILNDLVYKVLPLADNSALVCGGARFQGSGNPQSGMVFHVLANGSLDGGFGTAGVTYIDSGGMDGHLRDMALDASGRIVACGSHAASNMLVARLNSDGTIDNGLDANGFVLMPTSSPFGDGLRAVVIQPDGKYLLAGWRSTNAVILRMEEDGSLDTGYGIGGLVEFAVGAGNALLNDLVLLSDGSIVGVGQAGTSLVLVKTLADGTPDPGFGNNGVLVDPLSANSAGHAVVALGTAVIVAGTLEGAGSTEDILVAGFDASGAPLSGFGTNGIVTLDLLSTETAYGMSIQPDGKLLVGGYSGNGQQAHDQFLYRLLTDGSVDPSFGVGGSVTSSLATQATWMEGTYSIGTDPDGSILVAGRLHQGVPLTDAIYLQRYANDLANGIATAAHAGEGFALWNEGDDGFVLMAQDAMKDAQLDVFDATGRLLAVPYRGHLAAGAPVRFSLAGTTGVLLARLRCGAHVHALRFVH